MSIYSTMGIHCDIRMWWSTIGWHKMLKRGKTKKWLRKITVTFMSDILKIIAHLFQNKFK